VTAKTAAIMKIDKGGEQGWAERDPPNCGQYGRSKVVGTFDGNS
jgi:hypothetical protein